MPPVDRKNPQRSKSSDSRYSLMEFMRQYPDDDACLERLWRSRFSEDGEHAHCPKCDRRRSFKRYATKQRRQSWTCTACGHHIQPTAGTIFHRSSTSLVLWFYACYLMTSTKCGVSAKHLERELGVTYKTAWRMLNLIRNKLMAQDDDTTLSGEVEVDETYVGGKQRFQFGRPGKTSKKDACPRHDSARREGRRQDGARRLGSVATTRSRAPRRAGDHGLHRRVARVREPAQARLPAPHGAPRPPRIRPRSRLHKHRRGLLRERQEWDRRELPRRLAQVATGLHQRVCVAAQPPRRSNGGFRDAPASNSC